MKLNKIFKLKKHHILFMFLLILNVGLAVYWLSQKEGWFVDELWSYSHANSTQGAYLSDDINSFFDVRNVETKLNNRWLDGEIFHNYLTVQKNERFHYQHISDNLMVVEHPPLYFWILYTICSFTPEIINPWQAGSINLVAFLLALIVFYKLCKLFIKDNYLAMAPVFLWGFSDIGLSCCLYLRMYMMQTLFALCLLYEVCLLLKENKADKKRLFLIFLYSALGILTQYSSIIFSFVTAAVTCVVLFWRNNWKLLFYFSLMMLLSLLALFIVFPQAFDVLLFSYRAREISQKNPNINISSIWMALLYFQYSRVHSYTQLFGIYFENLFGIPKVYDIYLFLIAIVVGEVLYRKKISINPLFLPLFIILAVMTIYLDFFMPLGQYISLRYFMLLMPLASLLIMYLLIFILQNVKVPFYLMVLYLSMFVVWHTAHTDFERNVFRMAISEQTRVYTKEFENKNILVISEIAPFLENSMVLAKAKEVYFVLLKMNVDGMEIKSTDSTIKSIKSIYLQDESVIPQIADEVWDKADYVLLRNGWAWSVSGCFTCQPAPRILRGNIKERMQYVTYFKFGGVVFDLYKVIKDEKAL